MYVLTNGCDLAVSLSGERTTKPCRLRCLIINGKRILCGLLIEGPVCKIEQLVADVDDAARIRQIRFAHTIQICCGSLNRNLTGLAAVDDIGSCAVKILAVITVAHFNQALQLPMHRCIIQAEICTVRPANII